MWYADDSAAGGSIGNLKKWWDELCESGPLFGYFPNICKTHLLIQPDDIVQAQSIFANSNVNIITEAIEYFGGAIGSVPFITKFLEKEVEAWVQEIEKLSYFTCSEPTFRDVVYLRYGWPLLNSLESCICGCPFTIDHVLSCPRGGFTIVRHNELRDPTATLLSDVGSNVITEPLLQPLNGERFPHRTTNTAPNARLDIAANGILGGRFERTYFDVRVFNPYAPSNIHPTITETYRKHEQEHCKKSP